ncbi:MAG: type II secretion system protein GspN [Deltaproteobacteria bacterium]
MTGRKRMLRISAFLAAGIWLFITIIYLFFDMGRINEVINQRLVSQGLILTPGASKTFLPGMGWKGLLLSSRQGPVLAADRLKLQLGFLSLLKGRIAVKGEAVIGNGRLDLEYGVTGKKALDLKAKGIRLADVPFFKTVLGGSAGGSLWSEGNATRGKAGLDGEFKLEIKQLEFSGVKLGDFPLPDVNNLRSQGMVRLTDGRSRLESFTLEGEGIYMRLSGDIPNGPNAATMPLDLTLEIMPKPEFMEKQKLVFMLLAKFAVSPGVYRMPIKGTLLKPALL